MIFRRLRPAVALTLFVAAVAYALVGWHDTRSAWALNADPPAKPILITADRSFHEIGWILFASCTVGAAAAALAISRRLSGRVRTALLVVGLVAVTVGYVGNRAASHVDTHQPCACDDSISMG